MSYSVNSQAIKPYQDVLKQHEIKKHGSSCAENSDART